MTALRCPVCRSALYADPALERARLVTPEACPPRVLTCVHGHSLRLTPLAQRVDRGMPTTRPCPVCATPTPRIAARKYCSPACAEFARADSQSLRNRGLAWIPEERPWYKGAIPHPTEPEAPSVLTPAIVVPAEWLDGYSRIYAPLPLPAATANPTR